MKLLISGFNKKHITNENHENYYSDRYDSDSIS